MGAHEKLLSQYGKDFRTYFFLNKIEIVRQLIQCIELILLMAMYDGNNTEIYEDDAFV